MNVRVVVAPGARAPTVQVTRLPTGVQELVVAVVPAGSVAVTVPAVSGEGPLSVSVTV